MHGHDIFVLSTTALSSVAWEIKELWWTENETDLYLLPNREGALIIFSKGHALTLLFNIPLLATTKLIYWGDLDEHGFIMLNSFRKNYNHTVSVFMDKNTVEYHRNQILMRPEKYKATSFEYLTVDENEAFTILLQLNGRIEQEKLNQEYFYGALVVMS